MSGNWWQKGRPPRRSEMNDIIGLVIIGFLIICGLFGLSKLSKPYDVTVDELEKRAQEGPGLLGAGDIGFAGESDDRGGGDIGGRDDGAGGGSERGFDGRERSGRAA